MNRKDAMKRGMWVVVAIVLAIALNVLYWKGSRWINWKLSYGRKVDTRIEKLEERIETLEKHAFGNKEGG